MSRCCILGLGYIGLPTAAVLCDAGHDVIGVDINLDVVKALKLGLVHIFEPGLEKKVSKYIKSGKLKAQSKPSNADVFIIAVPTPFVKPESKIPLPNINFVVQAINSIIPFLKENNLVILESTCPVGTTEKVSKIILENTEIKRINCV